MGKGEIQRKGKAGGAKEREIGESKEWEKDGG
jgi:hypothetical protein